MKEFTDYGVDYFMGLFAIEDMEYQLEQTPEMDDPTLAEMTETALNILNTKPNGFVAFIEAGLVDHGHHGNKVHMQTKRGSLPVIQVECHCRLDRP